VTSSIEDVSFDLDRKVHDPFRKWTTLASYRARYTNGPGDVKGGNCAWCAKPIGPTPTPNAQHNNQNCMYWWQQKRRMVEWLDLLTCRFGGCDHNLGGNPGTTDLTYPWDGQCNKADCNGDGQTTINELLTAVAISLGDADVSACPAAAVSVPCASGTALFGQAAAGDETGFCEIVTVSDILQAINVDLRGYPGDPVPLPTVPPEQMLPNPETCDDSGNCHDPCDGCDFSNCVSSCGVTGTGHCGDYPSGDDPGCTYCEDYCLPATPTPPPTPTPTPTAECTIMLYRGTRAHPTPPVGYDCNVLSAFVQVLPPFKPTVALITQNPLEESIYMGQPTPQSDSSTKFVRDVFIVGLGPFYPTISVSDGGGELCHRDFGYDGNPATSPVASGVVDENGDPDLRLCGLGGGETPGIVWPRPATATMTPTPTDTPTLTPTPVPTCEWLRLARVPVGQGGVLLSPNSPDTPHTICPCDDLFASVQVTPPENAVLTIDFGGTSGTIVGRCGDPFGCTAGEDVEKLLVSGVCDTYSETHKITIAASVAGAQICSADYYVAVMWDGLWDTGTCASFCGPTDDNNWVYQETLACEVHAEAAFFCPNGSTRHAQCCLICPYVVNVSGQSGG
jgi:hypothetical protein